MKILFISAYDNRGGAAIACLRLANALWNYNHDIEVKVLVKEKTGKDIFVDSIGKSIFYRIRRFFFFAIEPLLFSFYAKSKKLRFAFSRGRFGNNDLLAHPWVKEADIIHLHWLNHGFLSLDNIEKLQGLGKPVVWTLHDMWAFTGGCHYSGNCEGYLKSCGNCPIMKYPAANDLSAKVWNNKLNAYKNISFMSSSDWLGNLALNSSLLKNFSLTVVPTPIDTDIFYPVTSKRGLRKKLNLDTDKIYLLFGAEIVCEERKGLNYLVNALILLKEKHPDLCSNIELLILGKKFSHELIQNVPFKSHYLGIMENEQEIAKAYNASSVFVMPSLEDNLPNMVIESLACGIPVVAFQTGGIPEMVDHKINGYLAKYKSPESLMEGIVWVILNEQRYIQLCKSARHKAENNFSYEVIAKKQGNFYMKLLNYYSLNTRISAQRAKRVA